MRREGRHASRLNDVGGGQPRFPAARKQVAPFRLRDLEGRVNSAFLNISQHFTGHLFRLWIPSSARGQGGGPRRFTAIVLNVSRRRFGGPEGVEPQSPGEPGPRRGGPLFATWIRASFEKQPVRTVAQGLATQSGITLLYLPSYSPNHQDVICPLRRCSMRCYDLRNRSEGTRPTKRDSCLSPCNGTTSPFGSS